MCLYFGGSFRRGQNVKAGNWVGEGKIVKFCTIVGDLSLVEGQWSSEVSFEVWGRLEINSLSPWADSGLTSQRAGSWLLLLVGLFYGRLASTQCLKTWLPWEMPLTGILLGPRHSSGLWRTGSHLILLAAWGSGYYYSSVTRWKRSHFLSGDSESIPKLLWGLIHRNLSI